MQRDVTTSACCTGTGQVSNDQHGVTIAAWCIMVRLFQMQFDCLCDTGARVVKTQNLHPAHKHKTHNLNPIIPG